MKKVYLFIIFLVTIVVTNDFAQARHESFENFECEYDCNSTCTNYFYEECVTNWYSASEYNPRVFLNSCNTYNVNASDGNYFAGENRVGYFIFYELPDGEIFKDGVDYLLSYDIFINDNNPNYLMFVEGYNNLVNTNVGEAGGEYLQYLGSTNFDGNSGWKKYDICYNVNNGSFNQLHFTFEQSQGQQAFYPSSDCEIPDFFMDNMRVICQQDYNINEINSSLDVDKCTKSKTFELEGLGECDNDLTDFPYDVEVYKQGDLVNSFVNTGNMFTLDFELFDESIYNLKIVGLNSDYCGYSLPTKEIDLNLDFIQSTEITDVEVWNSSDPVITNQNIFVRTGGFLTITGKVIFSPDSRIIVERGAKLVLDYGILTSCDQWPGVIVNGNSGLEQPNPDGMPAPDEAGIVITKNRSIIENAHVGISANYFGAWTDQDWGGLIQCDNTDFVGCRKAVEFMRYTPENKSFIKNCRLGGGDYYTKEGITIWDCNGILIENNYIHGLERGILSIDADYRVWHNNVIEDCEYGILADASSNGNAYIDVSDNNYFNNNYGGVVVSGQKSAHVDGNYFDENWKPIEVDGDDFYIIENNNFSNSGYSVGVSSSNDHASSIKCNDFIVQEGAIAFAYKNENSTFLSNTFEGSGYSTAGFDVSGLNANISLNIGAKYSSAKNLFSGFDGEIDWDNSNDPFNYHILKNDPPPRTIPHSEQGEDNYIVLQDVNNLTDPPGNCNTVNPPTVTENEVKLAIDDYCYWLALYRAQPGNSYFRWKFLQAKKKLLVLYYYWVNQNGGNLTSKQIETMLERLCDDRWRVTLYGHFMKNRHYAKADSLLNVLENPNTREIALVPEDLTDESRESFIKVQRINLKFQISNGAYQLTDDELATLQEEAVKPIPESAYAKGLYLLVTGIYIPREWPDRYNQGLQPRSSKVKVKEQWTIYPNPTDNELHINYTSSEEIEGKIVLYNLLGRKMIEKYVNFTAKSDNVINVSSLQDGVYILTITDIDESIIKTQKVMINSIK